MVQGRREREKKDGLPKSIGCTTQPVPRGCLGQKKKTPPFLLPLPKRKILSTNL